MGRSQPAASRLRLPPGYRAAATNAPLLDWGRARERLQRARTYWLATASPAGRPHVASLWGVWVDDALYFNGFSAARWARNVGANPAAVVHLEDGEDVVIVEGRVDDIVPPRVTGEQVAGAWSRKYGSLVPEPTGRIYRLTPRRERLDVIPGRRHELDVPGELTAATPERLRVRIVVSMPVEARRSLWTALQPQRP